jgi:hypothetical protein
MYSAEPVEKTPHTLAQVAEIDRICKNHNVRFLYFLQYRRKIILDDATPFPATGSPTISFTLAAAFKV